MAVVHDVEEDHAADDRVERDLRPHGRVEVGGPGGEQRVEGRGVPRRRPRGVDAERVRGPAELAEAVPVPRSAPAEQELERDVIDLCDGEGLAQ